MNKVILIGRISNDIDFRYTDSSLAVARFNLAVSKGLSKKKEEEIRENGGQTADFINLVCFGKTAELVAGYMVKGMQLAVEGRISTSSYENSEGKRVYKTEVMVERVKFLT